MVRADNREVVNQRFVLLIELVESLNPTLLYSIVQGSRHIQLFTKRKRFQIDCDVAEKIVVITKVLLYFIFKIIIVQIGQTAVCQCKRHIAFAKLYEKFKERFINLRLNC